MLLSNKNPVYNTIIVFSIIMLLLYITKPDVIYNHNKKKFRQFGTTNEKTLLPIYVIGILLAIILYVFFYSLTNSCKISSKSKNINNNKLNLSSNNKFNNYTNQNSYAYNNQQIQIQQLQNQMQQLIHQQLIQQQLNNQISNNIIHSNKQNDVIKSVLPNNLSF